MIYRIIYDISHYHEFLRSPIATLAKAENLAENIQWSLGTQTLVPTTRFIRRHWATLANEDWEIKLNTSPAKY